MAIDKKKWQEISEKYDTKAKWADAILLLNLEDHEDLISALIDLDPQDLVGRSPGDIYITWNNPPTSSTGELAQEIARNIEAEQSRRTKLANDRRAR